jgi:hypothetical protein
MSSNECIIPECYVDSCLVEVLLFAGRNHVNHQKGNGTVAKRIKEEFSNEFCVGIIDEDRRDLDYLKEFNLGIESAGLKLWKHKLKHQYIIQIKPVIEQWIINVCENSEISLVQFTLPDEIKSLKKESKSKESKKDIRFINLFKEMLRKDCEEVIKLKSWLEYLKKEKYSADINKLING